MVMYISFSLFSFYRGFQGFNPILKKSIFDEIRLNFYILTHNIFKNYISVIYWKRFIIYVYTIYTIYTICR